jgi:serine/threonine-protein kinase
VLGTVAYLAPEAALGMSAVDQRSDLYALGLILYELLAGQHPFDAKDPVRLFLQHRTEPPPPLATRAPGATVAPELEAVVRKLLEKDPKDRYASAGEVIAALDAAMLSAGFDAVAELAAGLPPQAPSASSPPPALPPVPADAAGVAAQSVVAARMDALNAMLHRAFRLPGIAKFVELLPDSGRFPRWAYVAFPVLGLGFVLSLILLSGRTAPNAPGGAAEPAADSVAHGGAGAGVDLPPASSAGREVTMEVAGLDASGWRMNLRNAARRKEWTAAAEAVLTLLRLDPGAFRDHDVQAGLRNTAVGLEDVGGEPSDKFFETLSSQAGSEGLDLVYDVARFRAGTKAGKRATEILRRPEVMMGGSPALKVLFDFREASCVGRRDLFSRMAEQGDERALAELVAQRDADCGRRDPCCYKDSRALGAAIRSLKARLSAPLPAATQPP